MAADLGVRVQELLSSAELRAKIDLKRYVTDTIGLPTLTDILAELAKPGRDPRSTIRTFRFADVHSLDDLVKLHQQVHVRVTGIDRMRGRISLSMKGVSHE